MTALLRIPDPTSIQDTTIKNYFNEVNRVNRGNFETLNNQLNKGTLTGTVTLEVSMPSTVISNVFIKASSVVYMMPTTSSAGVEVASGNLFYTASNGSITISHTNSATTGRTFSYTVFIN